MDGRTDGRNGCTNDAKTIFLRLRRGIKKISLFTIQNIMLLDVLTTIFFLETFPATQLYERLFNSLSTEFQNWNIPVTLADLV